MSYSAPYRLARSRQSVGRSRATAIAKYSENWSSKPDLIIFDDGRERTNPVTQAGRNELKFRRFLCWLRQWSPKAKVHLCCNCRTPLEWSEATFEHETLRSATHIDERLYSSKGCPINGASHAYCNLKRGSQRLPLWHGTINVRDVKLTASQFFHLVGGKCFCGRRKSSLSSRQYVEIEFKVNAGMQSVKPQKGSCFLSAIEGGISAYPRDPRQEILFAASDKTKAV